MIVASCQMMPYFGKVVWCVLGPCATAKPCTPLSPPTVLLVFSIYYALSVVVYQELSLYLRLA